MKSNHRRMLAVTLGAALAAAATAHAGYRLTDERGMQTAISKGRMKQMVNGGAGIQTSLDVTSGRMWMANPDKKIYWEGPIDEFCGQMKQAVSSMQQAMKASMEQHMKDMPPEQKAKMKEMMKSLGGGDADEKPPETKVVKTDEAETIAGLPTRKIQLLVDGKVASDYWITTDAAFGKELRLDKAAATMSKFRSCQSNSKGMNQISAMEDVFAQGFPLKTITYSQGKTLVSQTYDKVETTEIPEAEFAPPPGFRKVTLQEAMFAGVAGMKPDAQNHGGGAPSGNPR